MAALTRIPVVRMAAAGTFAAPLGGLAAAFTGSPASAAGTAVAAVLAWVKPEWFLLLLAGIAPFARVAKSAVFPSELVLAWKTALTLMLAFIWGIRGLLSQQSLALPRTLMIWASLWLGLTALSVLHAADPLRSLAYLPLAAAGAAMFVMTFHLDAARQRQLLWLSLGLGAALSGLVLLQYIVVTYDVLPFLARWIVEPRAQAYYAENPVDALAARYRPSGTMFHPNAMGLYFAVLLPFAAALAASPLYRGWKRTLLWAFTFLIGLGLLATNSRGALLFSAAALVYISFHRGYRRWLVLGAAGLGVLGLLTVSPAFENTPFIRLIESAVRLETGVSGRERVWPNAFALAKENSLLGVGPGNFSTEYVAHFGYFLPHSPQEQMGQLWAIQNLGEEKVIANFHAHNLYLQLWSEMGFAAPLLFIAGLLILLFAGERAASQWPLGSSPSVLGMAVSAWAFGLAFYGLFESPYAFTLTSINVVAAPLLALAIKAPQTPGFK